VLGEVLVESQVHQFGRSASEGMNSRNDRTPLTPPKYLYLMPASLQAAKTPAPPRTVTTPPLLIQTWKSSVASDGALSQENVSTVICFSFPLLWLSPAERAMKMRSWRIQLRMQLVRFSLPEQFRPAAQLRRAP